MGQGNITAGSCADSSLLGNAPGDDQPKLHDAVGSAVAGVQPLISRCNNIDLRRI